MTTVLMTGAAGQVGTMLRHRLPGLGWTIRSFDRAPIPDDGASPTEQFIGDITSPSDLDRAFAGEVEAVVHLAGQPSEAPWPVIRAANIEGTYQVFEAARRADVRRVVFASSNHAVGMTPADPGGVDLPDDLPARPDTLYGVSKAFGEALARYYVDRYDFQVACLRIGSCHDEPTDRRALATWLSPADCAGLVDAALRAPGLSFATAWGVSANPDHRWWSLAGMDALGYQPHDDAAAMRPELEQDEPGRYDRVVGGPFAGPEFGIDEIAARS